MIGFNHVMVGAIVGVVVKQPLLVAPIAFASHFVCDATPHMGGIKAFSPWKPTFLALLAFDAVICTTILLLCIKHWPELWLGLVVGTAFATLPDFLWIYFHKFGKPHWKFFRFHAWVQWGERPYGWIFEGIYAGLFALVLTHL